MGRCGFQVHDHAVLSVDQVVCGLGKKGGTARRGRPVDLLITRYATLPTRVCPDNAGVHGIAFALDQIRAHAATQHCIKQPAKQIIAVPETAVSILGQRAG